MNRHIYRFIAAVLAAITIVSCNDARKSETFRVLEDVDSYIEARPDSALAVLEGIDVEDLGSREEKAKYALLMSMALDKNYIDSIKQLEQIKDSRGEFIENLLAAFERDHPEFIEHLKECGLDEEEIRFCCMEVLGVEE